MYRICIKCKRMKTVDKFTTESKKNICLECWPNCVKRKYAACVIDHKMFAQLKKIQKGLCAICGADRPTLNSQPGDELFVDHDHETGAVRGLLCCACNLKVERKAKLGIPVFVDYLENPPARKLMYICTKQPTDCAVTVQNDAEKRKCA